MHVWHLSLP
jgi:hypothetical protein